MAKLAFATGGAKPDVRILPQGAGVELMTGGKADCVSTMTYNEYWQLIEAGMKPEQLIVFKYSDEGVATLEDGLYAMEPKLKDAATVDKSKGTASSGSSSSDSVARPAAPSTTADPGMTPPSAPIDRPTTPAPKDQPENR